MDFYELGFLSTFNDAFVKWCEGYFGKERDDVYTHKNRQLRFLYSLIERSVYRLRKHLAIGESNFDYLNRGVYIINVKAIKKEIG